MVQDVDTDTDSSVAQFSDPKPSETRLSRNGGKTARYN
jgi:hypothetical protein